MSAAQAAVLERNELQQPVFAPARVKDLEALEEAIAARVLPAALDHRGTPERICFRGRTIVAWPLDTRRFVRLMACHISMN